MSVRNWQQMYLDSAAPWDTGRPSPELRRVLREEEVTIGTALELGCGTGANAVFLAEQGFRVTAIDACAEAIKVARTRAHEAAVHVEFVEQDVVQFDASTAPFDFISDRGCYHCVRLSHLVEFQQMLLRCARNGSRFHLICGNANEPLEDGPPTVSEVALRRELEPLFEVRWLRPIRLDVVLRDTPPLGWSCYMVHR